MLRVQNLNQLIFHLETRHEYFTQTRQIGRQPCQLILGVFFGIVLVVEVECDFSGLGEFGIDLRC